MTVREKHSHVSPNHIEERCDAALLIAAGDALAREAEADHGNVPDATGDGWHRACPVCAAIAKWKKATDG